MILRMNRTDTGPDVFFRTVRPWPIAEPGSRPGR